MSSTVWYHTTFYFFCSSVVCIVAGHESWTWWWWSITWFWIVSRAMPRRHSCFLSLWFNFTRILHVGLVLMTYGMRFIYITNIHFCVCTLITLDSFLPGNIWSSEVCYQIRTSYSTSLDSLWPFNSSYTVHFVYTLLVNNSSWSLFYGHLFAYLTFCIIVGLT